VTAAQSKRARRERALLTVLGAIAVVGILFGEPVYLGDRHFRIVLSFLGVLAAVVSLVLARRSARSARVARARNEVIVESIVEGIWLVGPDGRTQYVNSQMAALLGTEPEAAVGRHVKEFLASEGDAELLVKAARADVAPLYELSLRRADGTLLDALVTIGPAVGAAGVVAVVADNTERRLIEQEHAELAAIVQTTGDAVIGVDNEGKIRRWNPASERLYGWTAAEAIGMDITLLVPPERVEESTSIWQRSVAGESTVDIETKRVRKDGAEVDVSMTISPLRDANGHVVGSAGVIRDIRERKRLEEQLRQAQKLEAIGLLAGGVAHDFNNSLMAIRGYAELLQMRVTDESLRSDAEAIQKAAESAAGVTRQLLAFSRRQVLEPKLLDVNEVVAGIEPMLRRLVGESIAVRSIAAERLGRVRADRSQLEQVLVNLVANARDAMPTGGTLTIETLEVDLPGPAALEEERRYVLLAVSDNGHGMTPEVKARAFDPFFTTKEKGPSSGLGLATVYGIVEQSGGYVWAYSEPGPGATFKIYLPLAEDAAAAATGVVAPGSLDGTETVLLVEDEETVRNVVRQMLTLRGYTVLVAHDGDEALAVAAAHEGEIHVAVSDVVMPRMGGPEFVRSLREQRPDVRALFISGYTDDLVLHHGVLEEGVVFLQKPFAGAALARKVREALESPAPTAALETR
jgi:PAS domain S-box-containing protein